MNKQQLPVHKERVGSASVAVWSHPGKQGEFLRASLQVSYRDAQGDWHDTTSFSEADLRAIRDAADAAWRWMRTHRGQSDEADAAEQAEPVAS